MIYHEERLNSVHPVLADFVRHAIERLSKHHPDWLIVCGWRGEHEQHEAFLAGTSNADWPNGKHNATIEITYPNGETIRKPRSLAVDISPYPYDAGRDKNRLYLMAGYMMALADEWGVKIRFGADWDGDLATLDQQLHDVWHIELVE